MICYKKIYDDYNYELKFQTKLTYGMICYIDAWNEQGIVDIVSN